MNEDSIFLEALEKNSAEARATFLDRACAGNAELRDSVERLLRAHERADEVLSDHAPGLPVTMDRAASEWIGSQIGPYKLLEQIGEGGFGVVVKARDEKLERVVAIKVLAPELARNPTARKRFLREARAAASVVHQHVVTIHAVDETPFPYLVMECIDGQSLQDKIDQQGHLELKEILRIGKQIAAGLAAAHAHGLIHRDVKPANILLENGVERVRITDFGLARAVDDVGVTRTGEMAGTPQYMSPEQAQGLALDARSDLFSFGSVLYAMCTGRSPFRAETTIDAIRRVCDDTPRPIHEINPEIPDWLVNIITRLLAKKPEERFQTARGVADLLGTKLAEVQHPVAVTGAPTNWVGVTSPPEGHITRSVMATKRHWTITISALLCLLAAFVLAESSSTTNLTSALLRLFTTTSTPISSADTSSATVPPAVPPTFQPDPEAFVLLGKSGATVGKFATLAEVVQNASDGDTIEIRGNGPYLVEPIDMGYRMITLRAGQGFRPALQLDASKSENLLTTDAPLVLEGIEFVRRSEDLAPGQPRYANIIRARGSALRVANCRFALKKAGIFGSCIVLYGTERAEFYNSEFYHLGPNDSEGGTGIQFDCKANGTLLVENCVDTGWYSGLHLTLEGAPVQHVSVRLRHNTWAGGTAIYVQHNNGPFPVGPPDASRQPLLSIEACQNVFDCHVWFLHYKPTGPKAAAPPRPWAEVVRSTLAWRDDRSLYPVKISLHAGPEELPPPAVADIAAWDRFWNLEPPASLTGRAKFQGGELYAIAESGSESLTPKDFRLRPDSAGYRAGVDRKDLGADVNLVGPGPAFERWKKTPAYQEWLKETNQLAAKRDAEPFVLLRRSGATVGKFATLGAAVQAASDGDTIEIRGNGPFVTKPIVIGTSLTIRAGEGFRPVMKADPESLPQVGSLLKSYASLILEGLELQWLDAHVNQPNDGYLLAASGPSSRLHAANCRFVIVRRKGTVVHCISGWEIAHLQFKNCQFLPGDGHSITCRGNPHSAIIVENSLIAGPVLLGLRHAEPVKALFTRNSILAKKLGGYSHSLGFLAKQFEPSFGEYESRPYQVESSANIFECPNLLGQYLSTSEKALSAIELERLATQLVDWREKGNLYAFRDGDLLELTTQFVGGNLRHLSPTVPLKTFADLQSFWVNNKEIDSERGIVRFQGEQRIADLRLTKPELLTPEDFRLSADSAGYRAGPDGKDIGADIDLVGPGPAYERFKASPEYQTWLKDSGQMK